MDPIYINNLPPQSGINTSPTDLFLIISQDGANNNSIALSELSKSFDSITAKSSSGININYNDSTLGLSVSGYGFVGIYNVNPLVSLDVSDNVNSINGRGQIRMYTPDSGRQIGLSIQDPNVYYQFSKIANDTNLYFLYSSDSGSTFSKFSRFDTGGNFAIDNSDNPLTDRLFVSGGTVTFKNADNAITFDPANTEIKTSATDEVLSLNYNNIANVNIGHNGVYVINDLYSPKVGFGFTTPNYLLHLSGSGQTARYQSNTTSVYQSYKNTYTTAYVGLINGKYFINSSAGVDNTFCLDIASKYLGLGLSTPLYNLHVSSTGDTQALFASTGPSGPTNSQIIVSADKTITDTGPRISAFTLARATSGPTYTTAMWSMANLYGNFVSTTYADSFALVKNGILGASPIVELTLDTNGNLDIQGSYTTASSYCKGKFIEVYKTRLTGSGNIYIDPLGVNGSSTRASGNFDTESPFSITNYAGKIQKITLMSSANNVSLINNPAYIEIYATTPATVASDGFTNITATGGSVPPSVGGNLKAYASFQLTKNSISQITSFNGTPSFASGQLLQYRIYDSLGSGLNVPVTITSSVNYTVI